MAIKKKLSALEIEKLISILETRFKKNMNRHKDIEWTDVLKKLKSSDKLWSLQAMEETGGEPDVISIKNSKGIIFMDCSAESPAGRRSLCYDRAALNERKEHKPVNSAIDMAEEMGIEMLDEEQYRELQKFGKFDSKTSSWLITPAPIRKLGGAIFGDYRYGQVFIYHNGVQSYYAARGFRGMLKI